MMERFNNSKAEYRTKTRYYSDKFKKAVRLIGRGELHFHNLRDTFAIIRYIQTRDIYQVSKELHHSSVSVTEKYANFYSIAELENDFPALVVNNSNLRVKGIPQQVKSLSASMGGVLGVDGYDLMDTQVRFIMGNVPHSKCGEH